MKCVVSRKLACQPKERLFKVVVRLCGDIVILKVLLSVEGDLLGLDLTILNLHLVSSEDDRDVLAHTGQVTVPVWNILVGDSRSDVKHDDGTLSLDVVSITKSSEFLRRSGKQVTGERMTFDLASYTQ